MRKFISITLVATLCGCSNANGYTAAEKSLYESQAAWNRADADVDAASDKCNSDKKLKTNLARAKCKLLTT